MYIHKNEMLSFIKQDVRLLIQENERDSVMRKQVFISTYLQDLHHQLSAIPGLFVPRMTLIKEAEFDETKFHRLMIDPLNY